MSEDYAVVYDDTDIEYKVQENPSGIRPMGYNVLVLPKEVEATTKGGLILAESTREKDGFKRTEGVLVATSPMAFVYDGDWPSWAEKPQPGERVMFAQYSGAKMTGRDGVEYLMMRDRDIVAVVEE